MKVHSLKLVLLILLALLYSHCADEEKTRDMTISSGTSFGECIGYCVRELELSADGGIYTATGWDASNYPELTENFDLSNTEWNGITALVDQDRLLAYPDVIGCPDCADGGAEWIKVVQGDFSRQITFEYGDSLFDIQPLLDKVRQLRARSEGQLFYE